MSAAAKAVARLEDRASQYEVALMNVQDAVSLEDAKSIARQAIRDAYFGVMCDSRPQ